MSAAAARGRRARILLIALLVIAVVVLGAVAVVLVPMLTHQSAGGSGQELPGSYVSETHATGADGRTRELRVERADGTAADLSALQPGEELLVTGSGFDAGIGIYVSFCAIPEAGEKPTPCLGGIPEGAESGAADAETLSSAWVTDDWAWRAFATHRFGDDGSFEVLLTVPESATDSINCLEGACAIATRADHTAGSDRVQDLLLPIAFVK